MAGLFGSMQQRFFPSDHSSSQADYPAQAPPYEEAVNSSRRPLPWTTPELTPYLGLRARLSQVWFNRWTVLLLLVVVRIVLATQSLNSDLESARTKAFSACTSVESMGSAMASMPFYMSKGVNELAATGIERAVQGLEDTLLLIITGVQEIIVFYINMITSTYLCLITLAITGAADVVLDATKEITQFINTTMSDIFNDISDDVKNVQDGINKVTKTLKDIPNFFGANVNIPDVTIPSLDKLKNISIPSDFTTKLDDLKNNLPTFKDVQKAGDDVIRIPFQEISKLINSSLGVYQFNRSLFAVPEKETMTFCSDNPSINNFFDGLEHTVNKVKKILVAVVVVLAILVMVPMAYREWWAWRSTRSRAQLITSPDRPYDPIDVVQIVSRPYPATLGLKMANAFKSSRRQTLVRWAVAYITSPPALFVLSLGIASLIGVLCQYILLRQVEVRAPALAAEVGQFADLVVNKLNEASAKWAVTTNQAINSTNADINNELFGWVKTGTDALNDTLNTVVDTMNEGIDKFLGGTILDSAVKDVLNCLVFYKIEGIQKGLTWVHDNAKVTFPTLPNDTFSLGATESVAPGSDAGSSFLSDPGADTTDKITETVVDLTEKWKKTLMQEAIISTCVIGVWLIVLLIAIIRTLVLFWGRDKAHGDGGAAPDNIVGQGPTSFRHRVASPIFPTFTATRSEGIPSPEEHEYPVEKGSIHMGTVSSRTTIETGGTNRESMYPKVYRY